MRMIHEVKVVKAEVPLQIITDARTYRLGTLTS